MWQGFLPKKSVKLEFAINYNKEKRLGGIRIWNYNRSAKDSTKGVKDIEVMVNDEKVWEGVVKIGKGATDEDYSTEIILERGIQLPTVQLPIKAEEDFEEPSSFARQPVPEPKI